MIELRNVDDVDLMTQVKALWRRNSKTLGFFPEGAFTDYADRGNILVAVDNDSQQVAAYVAFRESGLKIVIAHLCVNENYRGRGLTRTLVQTVSDQTRHFRGLEVRCREDFSVNRMWPKIGFCFSGEKPGRNADGKNLNFWWYDHGQANLFQTSVKKSESAPFSVVVDANVFFDLDSENDTVRATESKALEADFLVDSIELYITDELFNEIKRQKDPSQRQRQLSRASSLIRLTYDRARAEEVEAKLRTIFIGVTNESLESDIRQLSRAEAAGADFFVTRDGADLLSRVDQLYQVLRIRVVRPAQLLLLVDELERAEAYEPSRFSGTSLTTRPITSDEVEDCTFLDSCSGEKKYEYLQRVRNIVALGSSGVISLTEERSGLRLAQIGYDTTDMQALKVPLLRFRVHHPITPTLIRAWLFEIQRIAVSKNSPWVEVSEPRLTDEILRALAESHFQQTATGMWVKGCLNRIVKSGEMEEFWDQLARTPIAETIKSIRANGPSVADLESAFWPLKIEGTERPNFVVPIRPEWAKDLFDSRLADLTLFGAPDQLGLCRENAYYRSPAAHGGVCAPSRLLWYVSADRKYPGSMSVRAVSELVEVETGRVKDLYKKYHRLGTFRWRHATRVSSENSPDGRVMVFRFRDTEIFPNPISWELLQHTVRTWGVSSNFQSPTRIPEGAFFDLYRLGSDFKKVANEQ